MVRFSTAHGPLTGAEALARFIDWCMSDESGDVHGVPRSSPEAVRDFQFGVHRGDVHCAALVRAAGINVVHVGMRTIGDNLPPKDIAHLRK